MAEEKRPVLAIMRPESYREKSEALAQDYGFEPLYAPMNQGNSSGIGIGCVSWDGAVHADQFWRHYSFGNVRERPFSEIWTDLSDEIMSIGLLRSARLHQGEHRNYLIKEARECLKAINYR